MQSSRVEWRRVACWVASAIALLLFGFADAVGAKEPWPPEGPPRHRPPGGRPHGGPPPPLETELERNAERLGIDAETEAAIQAISRESRAEGERLRDALEAAHSELRALLASDAPDESAVMQQVERIGGLETELHKSRLRGMLRVRGLLTAEQRALLVEIHEERRARRGERRGPGRHVRPHPQPRREAPEE